MFNRTKQTQFAVYFVENVVYTRVYRHPYECAADLYALTSRAIYSSNSLLCRRSPRAIKTHFEIRSTRHSIYPSASNANRSQCRVLSWVCVCLVVYPPKYSKRVHYLRLIHTILISRFILSSSSSSLPSLVLSRVWWMMFHLCTSPNHNNNKYVLFDICKHMFTGRHSTSVIVNCNHCRCCCWYGDSTLCVFNIISSEQEDWTHSSSFRSRLIIIFTQFT